MLRGTLGCLLMKPARSSVNTMRFVEGNLKQALSEEQRPGAERKLTGKEEACWWQRPAPVLQKAAPAGH